MNLINIKLLKAHLIKVCFLLLLFCGCKKEEKLQANITQTANTKLEAFYKTELLNASQYLDSITFTQQKDALVYYYKKSRESFKKVEAIISFLESENYKALNQPNILKIEEEDATDIKINNPFGYQVIEELLIETNPDVTALNKQAKKTASRLKLIHGNTSIKLKKYHLLWLIRDQIIRVGTTGIAGFDSPNLNALQESIYSYQGINSMLEIYKSSFKNPLLLANWKIQIDNSISQLKNSSFNDFNRYSFIKNHTHKQLQLILDTKKDWNVKFPYALAFNNDVTSLFSAKTYNKNYFDYKVEEDSVRQLKAKLGKLLFNDQRLSSNNTMSCATCHISDLAFADNLKAFSGQKRNTPTLTYAALQKRFFYDGRTGNLEGQIVDVINNPKEFHTNLLEVTSKIETDSFYKKQFKILYNKEVNQEDTRNAIANFIRELAPFNSKFDNNINNLENTLTSQEIDGFNLFMGKAKCATCHFAPIFNGTIPPLYKETEFEFLGVPKSVNNKKIDNDYGRFDVYKTPERKHFFKTSTVRNSSKTFPYMHNGIYNTLEEVLEFYNNGGGNGIGFNQERQTLPSDSLNLSQRETKAIIAFINTLEDRTLAY